MAVTVSLLFLEVIRLRKPPFCAFTLIWPLDDDMTSAPLLLLRLRLIF